MAEPYNKDPSSVVSSKKALILSKHSEGEDIRSSGVCLFDYRVSMERLREELSTFLFYYMKDMKEMPFRLPHHGGAQPQLDVGEAFRVDAQS